MYYSNRSKSKTVAVDRVAHSRRNTNYDDTDETANLPNEDLGNLNSTWIPLTSTLPRRPSPASAMVDISRMNKLECVPQPVEARISENAPRGAREREFLSGVPPSGSKSKARPGTPISVQLANLPSPSAGQQQQEAPQLWEQGGDLTKKT